MFRNDLHRRVTVRMLAIISLLAIVIIGIIVSFAMARATRQAETRTKQLYSALVLGDARTGDTGKQARAVLDSQFRTFGPVLTFRIETCFSQISTRPAVCTVQVERESGIAVERLYWYGDQCLKIEVEEVP